jgi:hypothetical protein
MYRAAALPGLTVVDERATEALLARSRCAQIPNCAVTGYVFDPAVGRLFLRALKVVHRQRSRAYPADMGAGERRV